MGKGSKRRPEEGNEYLDGWERIWGKRENIETKKVTVYKEKIKMQFDELEAKMEHQIHLTDPEQVRTHMSNLNYKWEFISEEDRDFYQGCIFALENGLKWD